MKKTKSHEVISKLHRPKLDIFEFQSSVFGEEIARLNLLPKRKLLNYIEQRQRNFSTPDDQILIKGFPTEYWSSIDEIPKL